MARIKPPEFVLRLKTALESELKKIGMPAEVEYERLASTRLYRFVVLARKFKALWHTERQDLVWRIAEQVLSREEQLRVSMILTLTPEELGEESKEGRLKRRRPA